MAAAKRVGTLLKGIGGRLQHLYYATNFALMSTYALIRPGVLAHEKGKDYEGQMGALLTIALLTKLIKLSSFEHYLDMFFLYGKCALLVLSYVSDTVTFVRVILLVAAVTLVTPLPQFTSLPHTELLTPALFEERVRKDAREGKQVWLVYACATWHSPSYQRARTFAGLAEKYSGGKIHFGLLPLDRWPAWGIKNLKMDITTSWQQLPSIILFEGGEEVDRIPRVGHDGAPPDAFPPQIWKVAKGRWTEEDIVKHLKLEERRAKADDAAKKKK